MSTVEQERRIADLERVLEELIEIFEPVGTEYRVTNEDTEATLVLDWESTELVDLAREVLWGGAAEVEE